MLVHSPNSTQHNENFIRRFIRQVIIKKSGLSSKKFTGCSREFVSQDAQAYLHSKDIEHITTITYCPQVNGCVKHLYGVLLLALRKLSGKKPSSWVKHLPRAFLMARSCINSDIHFSPSKMVYSYQPEIKKNPKDSSLLNLQTFTWVKYLP